MCGKSVGADMGLAVARRGMLLGFVINFVILENVVSYRFRQHVSCLCQESVECLLALRTAAFCSLSDL